MINLVSISQGGGGGALNNRRPSAPQGRCYVLLTTPSRDIIILKKQYGLRNIQSVSTKSAN